MVTLLTVIHVVACIFLILVVLLQAGKGGGVGVALGGQTSAQVFGGRGAGNFLERLTSVTAVIFMVTSMSLAYLASRSDSARMQKQSQQAAEKKKADDAKAADDKARKEAEDRAVNAPAAGTTPEEKSEAVEGATPNALPAAGADEPKGDAPKAEPKTEAPKAEPVKVDAPKAEPKTEAPKTAPKKVAPKAEEPKAEPKTEAPAAE